MRRGSRTAARGPGRTHGLRTPTARPLPSASTDARGHRGQSVNLPLASLCTLTPHGGPGQAPAIGVRGGTETAWPSALPVTGAPPATPRPPGPTPEQPVPLPDGPVSERLSLSLPPPQSAGEAGSGSSSSSPSSLPPPRGSSQRLGFVPFARVKPACQLPHCLQEGTIPPLTPPLLERVLCPLPAAHTPSPEEPARGQGLNRGESSQSSGCSI